MSQLESALTEARSNARAVSAVVTSLSRVTSVDEAIELALQTVRTCFGWAYGSYWRLDPADDLLVFAHESGAVNEEFRRVTREATFARGVGLSGRTWQAQDLVFVPDIGELTDCVRAPSAQRAGVRSGVCFPIVVAGEIAGTMDFFATEVLEPSAERLDALRAVGVLVSQLIDRLTTAGAQRRAAEDVAAVSTVLRVVSQATSADEALGGALDVIRERFGWDYASYWSIDRSSQTLRFAQESGSVNEEFREVTRAASFAEGVGLSGRAWRARDLVFVADLAEVTDCVRAPAARRAGVKSGVCLPVMVEDEVVGTLDFFATRTLTLEEGRRSTLRNAVVLIGQALGRFEAAERLAEAASELVASIEEVERNVQSSTLVAQDGGRRAEEANEDVAALSEASAEIGQVVRVIQGIAAQTNLLALNATIEAARAGDSGRGFAVVANEVKALATETADATRSVSQKVELIQHQVDRVSSSLRDIDGVVRRINESQEAIGGVLAQQIGVTRSILS